LPVKSPPAVAIIANEQTPYRLHLHRRIVRELPEIELWSLFTHQLASSPWDYREVQEIRPVLFGAGQSSADQTALRNAGREWRKGGEIVQWLRTRAVKAVVLFGYNDSARMRILRWCRRRGVACFLFGDGNLLNERAAGLRAVVKRAYVPWVIRQCTGVFHCGALGREYFLKYGAKPESLYPFPYEPDYDRLASPDPAVVIDSRIRFDLRPERRRLLFAGRLTHVKRVDLLIDAFARILEKRPEWDLVIAGDGELRSELEMRPSSARSAGRIRWTGFLDDEAQLAALYSLCDVFVLPSEFEPWGVVLTEAATRLALVASSVVGAARDILGDGRNGLRFETGDVDSLTTALLGVTDPARIDGMKCASPELLAQWRKQTNPVYHLGRALRDCHVLN
jgi:glycosyltransferase involved in cell wall biosynthesis